MERERSRLAGGPAEYDRAANLASRSANYSSRCTAWGWGDPLPHFIKRQKPEVEKYRGQSTAYIE